MIYQLEKTFFQYDHGFKLCLDRLEISKNEVIGIYGPNGSGKTTLLKMLAFLLTPQQGNIIFFEKKSPRKYVTLLLQSPKLLNRSIYQNLIYPLRLRKKGINETIIKQTLSLLGFKDLNFQKSAHAVSTGEIKRIALAMCLLLETNVLLLDEPFAHIDPNNQEKLFNALNILKDNHQKTMVIASHDIDLLKQLTTHIIYLDNGKVIKNGR